MKGGARERGPSPRLAVSIGCPGGVGPEVSVVAASASRARVLLVGDATAVEAAAVARRVGAVVHAGSPEEGFAEARSGRIVVWQPTASLAARDRVPGRASLRGGAAQLAWVDAATDLVAAGRADALVTGPVSKEAIVRSRAPGSARFLGHTEHLARRLGVPRVIMAFANEKLATSLVTTHLPLARVPRAVDRAGVVRATVLLAALLARLHGRGARLAVASLNPHAGEGGLLGHEEERVIAPAVAEAKAALRRQGHVVVGPVPAETAYRKAAAGEYDGVVAMYHDQATIPMKLLAFGDAVNITLGLPIVRTSVDHGTGYDIAGRSLADAGGMEAALALAARLVGPSPRPRSLR